MAALQTKHLQETTGRGEIEDGEVESESETKLANLEALTSALLAVLICFFYLLKGVPFLSFCL